ncbi:MAG: Lrp/AsnC ligand binding domain-containing protein [Deltaproteobacteria bacterium]|nr:Lrp/AsnC ligand binding domain-containing protein [Deltaproteobacteria bacterium]
MSASAYILIEGAAGRIHRILEELKQIDSVVTCDSVTGQFDIIALVKADDANALGRLGLQEIQLIDGVLRTITCNVIEL